MKKVKVLWVSRHDILPVQEKKLERLYPNHELIKLKNKISSAMHLYDYVKKHNINVVIPVLPLSFIAYLIEKFNHDGIVILRPEMKLLHTCDGNCKEYDPKTDSLVLTKEYETGKSFYRHFRFEKFVKIKDIQIITEDITGGRK